jgi:5-methylcytosine-specific restriction protein A
VSPSRPAQPCRAPLCRHLAPCPVHGQRKPWAGRLSATERGYGGLWPKLRKLVLARDPICTICRRAASTQVDHRRPKANGGDDSEMNLRGVCTGCHRTKSSREGRAAR